MQSVLKCLRCSGEMELGRILNQDAMIHPYVWAIHDPDFPWPPVFGFHRGAAGERLKAAAERVKRSKAEVHAHRCVKCGYVELHAPRSSDGVA